MFSRSRPISLISPRVWFGCKAWRIDRNLAYARATRQIMRERLTSTDIGATCAYGFNVGPGVASIIGGVSAQQLDY
jgi:hypothetical protein